MANEKSIVEAMRALEFACVEAVCLGETLTIPDAAPPWAHLFQFQADRISQAAEALERLINREVLPLVRDFESVRAGVKK